MIDNQSVGCNWLSIMKLQRIPNPTSRNYPDSSDLDKAMAIMAQLNNGS